MGVAKRTNPSSSRCRTPSATLGVPWRMTVPAPRMGKSPPAIMVHRASARSSSGLSTMRPPRMSPTEVSRVIMATARPSRTTGTYSSRTAVVPVHSGSAATTTCTLVNVSTAMASRAAGILRPMTSSRCTVEPVEGRQWATATKRLVAVRAHRTRSETDRSAMTCQSAMS